MQSADYTELLKSTYLFADLQTDQYARLNAVLARKQLKREDTLFHYGDTSKSLFIIANGAVRIERPSEGGKNTVIAILKQGDIFGEMAAIDDQPRSAGAVAHSDTIVLKLMKEDFEEVLYDVPGVAVKLLHVISSKLRETTNRMEASEQRPLTYRLAAVLTHLAEDFGQTRNDTMIIQIPLTQELLGQLCAGTRESINRVLSQWSNDGIIDRKGKTIIIIDDAALKALLED